MNWRIQRARACLRVFEDELPLNRILCLVQNEVRCLEIRIECYYGPDHFVEVKRGAKVIALFLGKVC